MDEGEVVRGTPGGPATVASMRADLRELGVRPDSVLLVHSSLSALRWVTGGPVAVVQALLAALGPESTLVMPAYSSEYTDPGDWENPPVPEVWWPVIRESMPAFEAGITPTRAVGVIAECFRTWPGAVRSDHPHTSFCAMGPMASSICDGHALESSVGEASPIARVYDADGSVLLLGVGYGRNSSFHLAEYRATFPGKRNERNGSPVLVGGKRTWVEYEDLDLWGGDFRRIGAAFEGRDPPAVRTGSVAAGKAALFSQRAAVDFAVGWIEANREGDWRVPEDRT
ncbi:MAG: AAC(3) family N-acetyltransferase [Planctomycetota bacterium]